MTTTIHSTSQTWIQVLIDDSREKAGIGHAQEARIDAPEFQKYLDSLQGSQGVDIDPPTKRLTVEQMTLVFQVMVNFTAKLSQQSMLTELAMHRDAAKTQMDAQIANFAATLEKQRAQRESLKKSGVFGWIAKVTQAVMSVPVICKALSIVGRAVTTQKLPPLATGAGGLMMLAMALKPLLEIALAIEGKGRTVEDLMGGDKLLAALVTADLATLTGMTLESLMKEGAFGSRYTNDESAKEDAKLTGQILGMLMATTMLMAFMGSAGGGKDKQSGLNTLMRYGELSMRIAGMTHGLSAFGAGEEDLHRTRIEQEISRLMAELQDLEAGKTSIEERSQHCIQRVSTATQCEQFVVEQIAKILRASFEAMSLPLESFNRATA